MAYADRIKDTVSTGGTGTITLSGSPAATYRALSNIGATGTTFDYVMEDGTNWEIGVGTTGATANTFTRAVTISSNANAAVNFAASANFFITAAAASLAAFVTASSTNTFTNKRITPRTYNYVAPTATPTFSTDTYDTINITGLAVTITSMTTNLTGTPVDGDLLTVRITDNGTARGIAWGSKFVDSTITIPLTTVATKRLNVYFEYNSVGSVWQCVGAA